MTNHYSCYNCFYSDEYSILSLNQIKDNHTKIAFLDRDGVLIADVGHIVNSDDVCLLPHANKLLYRLKSNGYMTAVVTNQSSVSKGLATQSDYRRVTSKFLQFLNKSCLPDYIIASFHSDSYSDSQKEYFHWRKPGIGMFEYLLKKHSIDPEGCIMFGDKLTDLVPAYTLGFRQLIHVLEGFHSNQLYIIHSWSNKLDTNVIFVRDLNEAYTLVLQ